MLSYQTQFSEVLPYLNADEAAWLEEQLEPIAIVGDRVYAANELPDNVEPDWSCFRLRRGPKTGNSDETASTMCQCLFLDDDDDDHPVDSWGHLLWFHGKQLRDVGRVARLVQKFLRQFRPDQCWSLAYARTCSAPLAGKFGGGAVFVTPQRIERCNVHDLIEKRRKAFAHKHRRE